MLGDMWSSSELTSEKLGITEIKLSFLRENGILKPGIHWKSSPLGQKKPWKPKALYNIKMCREIINKFYKDKIEISIGIDSFKDARDNWSDKYGCETRSNISDIDPSKVNFVIVITPSGSHAEDSKQLLQKGINVLCEKPIGLNIDEVQENIEIADGAGLSYGGVFQNRMNKPILYVKQIFENEDFGNIISAGVKLQWCRLQE